jgi:hypothetical protein
LQTAPVELLRPLVVFGRLAGDKGAEVQRLLVFRSTFRSKLINALILLTYLTCTNSRTVAPSGVKSAKAQQILAKSLARAVTPLPGDDNLGRTQRGENFTIAQFVAHNLCNNLAFLVAFNSHPKTPRGNFRRRFSER